MIGARREGFETDCGAGERAESIFGAARTAALRCAKARAVREFLL